MYFIANTTIKSIKIYPVISKLAIFLAFFMSFIARGEEYNDWLKLFSSQSPIPGAQSRNLACAQKKVLHEIIKEKSPNIKIPYLCFDERAENQCQNSIFDRFGNEFLFSHEEVNLSVDSVKNPMESALKFKFKSDRSLNIFLLTYENALNFYLKNLNHKFNFIFLSPENPPTDKLDRFSDEYENLLSINMDASSCYKLIYRHAAKLRTNQERDTFYNNAVLDSSYNEDVTNLVVIYNKDNCLEEDPQIFNLFHKKMHAYKQGISQINLSIDFIPEAAKRLDTEKIFLILGLNVDLFSKPINIHQFQHSYPAEYASIVKEEKIKHEGIKSLLTELDKMSFEPKVSLTIYGMLKMSENETTYSF